jgi:hypothetical protein
VTRRDDFFLWTVTSKNSQSRKGRENGKKPKPNMLSILHNNVQSINNKLLELNILLQSELVDVDVLCLTDHWLREGNIKLISNDKFKLTGNFSRSRSDLGGSCIYVKHHLQT